MKKYDAQGKSTRTRVETLETTTTRTAHPSGETGLSTLTPLEEKVIRMLHGLGEEDSKVLEFAVGASEDARLRLTLMEAHNVAELDGEVPVDRANPAAAALAQDITARFGDRN